jgi:hypothetical protein
MGVIIAFSKNIIEKNVVSFSRKLKKEALSTNKSIRRR